MRLLFSILFVSLGLITAPFLIACDGGDGRRRRPPPRPPADDRGNYIVSPPSDWRQRSSKSCEAKDVSIDGNCSFRLPNLKPKRSNLYTGTYSDPNDVHGVNNGGPIFGLGQWYCDNGEWKKFRPPICRTCRKGLSFRKCLIRWNVPPCMFEDPGTCSRQ